MLHSPAGHQVANALRPWICLLLFAAVATARGEPMTYFEGPRTSTLDFKLTSEGKPVIAANVHGRSTFLFLDTGASTILDLAFAREIGLKPVETDEQGTGLTGLAGKRWVAHVDLRIGEMKITSYPVSCLNLSALRSLHAKTELPDLVGLVGSDLLLWLQAEIDYRKKVLRIRRPEAAPAK